VQVDLSDEQIESIVRKARCEKALRRLLPEVGDFQAVLEAAGPLLDDPSCSQNLLRGLLVLSAFPLDGSGLDLREVSKLVQIARSSTHRYARTWAGLGRLSQEPRSRQYHRTKGSASREPSGELASTPQ